MLFTNLGGFSRGCYSCNHNSSNSCLCKSVSSLENQSIKNESIACRAATQSMFVRCCVCEDFLVPCVIHTQTHMSSLHVHSKTSILANVFSFWMSPLPAISSHCWAVALAFFFLMHHMCSIHCSTVAKCMVLFQMPKIITLDQPLSPQVQLSSTEQLLKSLPFTALLKKWK